MYGRGRRPALPVGDGSLEAELAAAVETTIGDLRNERDARRAVIAAYAQMERTLAAHGCRRNAAEAPFEYLGRILRGLDVRDSGVRTLTDLFEYAKFSPHEIAAHRLRTRYGVELDREAVRARELVGAQAWELVRPDRPPPKDRLARGPDADELAVVVDQLEAI